MQGLRYAVEHPQEAAQILHRYQPNTDVATAAAELELMRAYTVTDQPGVPAGAFDPVRVARSVAMMHSAGLIPEPVDPASFVDFTVMSGPNTAGTIVGAYR